MLRFFNIGRSICFLFKFLFFLKLIYFFRFRYFASDLVINHKEFASLPILLNHLTKFNHILRFELYYHFFLDLDDLFCFFVITINVILLFDECKKKMLTL